MRRLGLKSLVGIPAVATIAAIAVLAIWTQTGHSQSPGPSPLSTVSRRSLDGARISMAVPQEAAARKAEEITSKGRAEQMTLERWPNSKVAEARLMEVEDRLSTPPVRCLCWVVVVDSPEPVYIHQPAEVVDGRYVATVRIVADESYRFDLIDATTGKFMYGVEGAAAVHEEPIKPETDPRAP